jgi:hypothetical protein
MIVEKHPTAEVKIDPAPLSAAEYIGCLMDAMSSLHQYNWKTDVDLGKLTAVRTDLFAFESAGWIIIRGRSAPREVIQVPPAHDTTP